MGLISTAATITHMCAWATSGTGFPRPFSFRLPGTVLRLSNRTFTGCCRSPSTSHRCIASSFLLHNDFVSISVCSKLHCPLPTECYKDTGAVRSWIGGALHSGVGCKEMSRGVGCLVQGGTAAAPPQLNSGNREEPANYWPDASQCHFFVGLQYPDAPLLQGKHTPPSCAHASCCAMLYMCCSNSQVPTSAI